MPREISYTSTNHFEPPRDESQIAAAQLLGIGAD